MPKSSIPTLLDRLGGIARVEHIVECTVARLLDDSQLRPRFAGMDAAALKASQTTFLTAAFGGPATAHPSQPAIYLDDEQFGRFVLHIYETLLSLGIPDIFTEQLVLAVMTRALSDETWSEVTAGPSNSPSNRSMSSLAQSLSACFLAVIGWLIT